MASSAQTRSSQKLAMSSNYDILDENLLEASSEILPGRLYFIVLRTYAKPKYTLTSHYFTVDDELRYDPFYEDFGPLNLGQLYHYCHKLNGKLQNASLMEKKIVHYTSTDPQKRVNSAYLIGSYAVLYLKMTPNEVFGKLTTCGSSYLDFRDASMGTPYYTISLLDCLNAVSQAKKMNFFDFKNFNVSEYEHYETVENGDLNWIVPGKFLAFAGPQTLAYSSQRSLSLYSSHAPESYIRYFHQNNVTTVIRLNNKLYDASRFTEEGIDHQDVFFFDGSTPKDELVERFLKICEDADGAVAVHCKAGLGRTGSMIACYIMKWYHFSAREAIAWLRICRPASIIGHQQEWLESKQQEMWWAGKKLKPPKHKQGIYPLSNKDKQPRIGTIQRRRTTHSSRPAGNDSLSRITDKVTSMTIDSAAKDVNKNPVVTEEQGDRLNRIKMSRLSARSSQKVVRSSWPLNAVNSVGKRTSSVGKVIAPRKSIGRNKNLSVNKSLSDDSASRIFNETASGTTSTSAALKQTPKQTKKAAR